MCEFWGFSRHIYTLSLQIPSWPSVMQNMNCSKHLWLDPLHDACMNYCYNKNGGNLEREPCCNRKHGIGTSLEVHFHLHPCSRTYIHISPCPLSLPQKELSSYCLYTLVPYPLTPNPKPFHDNPRPKTLNLKLSRFRA